MVAMPTTSARMPKTIVVMLLSAPSSEAGLRAESATRDESRPCRGDIFCGGTTKIYEAREVELKLAVSVLKWTNVNGGNGS